MVQVEGKWWKAVGGAPCSLAGYAETCSNSSLKGLESPLLPRESQNSLSWSQRRVMTSVSARCQNQLSQDFTPRFTGWCKDTSCLLGIHCRLPALLSLAGRNEERKGRKRLWSLLSLADGLCHVRGAVARQDLPKHSSLCSMRRKNHRAACASTSVILWWRRMPVSGQTICIRAANSLRAWSCRVPGRHSPRSYLETLCFINRAGWGPPCHHPIPQTCSYSSLCSQFCLL